MSLFSEKKIVELEIPTAKPGKEGANVIATLVESISSGVCEDTLFVFHGPKAGKDVQRAKWFKSLEQKGVFVPCYPIEGRHLHQWIASRLQQATLNNSADLCRFIADLTEGNLLAAKQEIDKLALLFPNGDLDLIKLQNAMVDHSRYDVFQLADCLLQGEFTKAIKILGALEAEGTEPNLILWGLIRECQTLMKLKDKVTHGENINWIQLGIWRNRQLYYQNALSRLSDKNLDDLRSKLIQMDLAFKQQSISRPYVELCHLCLLFGPYALDEIELFA